MADRLTDAELREIVDTEDWTLPDPRALVVEVVASRARIAELEAASTLQAIYDTYLKHAHGIDADSDWTDFLAWKAEMDESEGVERGA
ncbi:hypothetical protein [Nocardia sp. NPDC060249]|uniref:hypothetical protein n=1 Tax=Nocardia sp. NPDC060249 TaxID=3347082 RepID=UPI003649C7C4